MDVNSTNSAARSGNSQTSDRVGLSIPKSVTAQPPTGSPVEDTVELSPEGKAISRAEVESHLRITPTREIQAELDEISGEIKAGEFLTAERTAGTVERLLDLLG